MGEHHYVPEFDEDGECVGFVTALDCTALEEEWWEQLYEEERQRDDDDGSGEKIHFWNDRRELSRRFSMLREDALAEGFRLMAEEYLNDGEEELWPRAQRALKRHARFRYGKHGVRDFHPRHKQRGRWSLSLYVCPWRFRWGERSGDIVRENGRYGHGDWLQQTPEHCRKRQKPRTKEVELLRHAEEVCRELEGDEPIIVQNRLDSECEPQWRRWFFSVTSDHPPAPDHANWRHGRDQNIRWSRAFDPRDLKR